MRDPYHDHPAHVALVTTSWPSRAGDWAGHFVREEALELVREGARVTVLTTRTALCGDDGVSVISLGGGSAFGPPGAIARIRQSPPRLASAALWTARAFGALRRERWDRVIAHWAIPCGFPISMGPWPLEVVSHGSDVRLLERMPPRVRGSIVSSIAARAERWRFVSASLRDALLGSLERDLRARVAAKSFVREPLIAMPDVTARARQIRAELGRFDVSVGRLVARKRVDKAIDRAASTRELLVVVGDGPERADLERRAARRSARVKFLGDLPRDEALAYLAAARALVFASESEGCSTVVREARALSTPVETIR